MKALFYNSESQNLMNLKDFFTVKLIARNLNYANIQTFHHEFIIKARKLWRHFFMNLKTKFWRISKIFYSQTSCSKAEFLQIFKCFIMNLLLEQESSEVTAFLWIWKRNFDEFYTFFYSQTACSKTEFMQILKLFIMNLSLEQESSESTFSWIWEPNFDDFQSETPCSKLNFCEYWNFSCWIRYYIKKALMALSFTNLKEGKIWRISKIFTLKLLAVMMNICKNEGGYSINPVQGQKNVFFDHPWWILHCWT